MGQQTDTQIAVSIEVWSELGDRKGPGTPHRTFDDVLRELLGLSPWEDA